MTDAYSDLLGDDEDDSQPEPKPDSKANAAFAQQRKELKEAQKKLAELEAFKAERERADREATVTSVFSEVGLNPKHAKFYQGEEVTAGAIKAWAVAEDFLQVNEDEAAPAPAERGFTPTVINEGQALGSKVYTHDEFIELQISDPARAMQAYRAGRVQLEKAPGGSIYVGRDR